MCSCGCNTCETKGPLLIESKVKSLLSEGLNHHIINAVSLHETVYRYGSIKHLSLIKEARKLYSRNVIDLNEHDVELIKTHLGEWGLYEGESIPLDLPMLNEREDALGIYDDNKGNSASINRARVGFMADVDGENDYQIGPAATMKELIKMLADEGFTQKIFEAQFKGKDVSLNKPKRGGSKAYYVYVKDGDKVKKVSFGSGGLRAKINNKDARSAFAARHNCDKKKDRTTAGYWSCNLPRYAKALGLGANKNTFW